MATTDVGGVITLTEADLDPYATRVETRRLLMGPWLPCGSALPGLAAQGGPAVLRRVAELVDEAEKLAEELREQQVVEMLRTVDRDLESLVRNGVTGEVCPARVHPRHPDPVHLSPLAPPLGALLGFAAPREAPTASRGPFVPSRYGAKAVEAVPERLPSLDAVDAVDDLAPYSRTAALIRPLARIARPGEGLALALPPRLLDEEFGSAAIVRFEDVDFPDTLTHQPTRRFLSEVGLPEHGYWYELDTDVPLPTLVEHHADEDGIPAVGLPEGADRLIRLGPLLEGTSLVVDGATGAVLCWSEPDALLRPLNADVSTLAFTVWLVHREQAPIARP